MDYIFDPDEPFNGDSTNTVDSKCRIFVPAKWRDHLGDRIIIHVGFGRSAGGKYLEMLPYERFKKFTDKMKLISSTDTRFENMRRFIFRNTEEVVPDKQGRVLIPKRLLDYASIHEEAYLVGAGECLEIWNPDLFRIAEEKYDNERFVSDLSLFNAETKSILQ